MPPHPPQAPWADSFAVDASGRLQAVGRGLQPPPGAAATDLQRAFIMPVSCWQPPWAPSGYLIVAADGAMRAPRILGCCLRRALRAALQSPPALKCPSAACLPAPCAGLCGCTHPSDTRRLGVVYGQPAHRPVKGSIPGWRGPGCAGAAARAVAAGGPIRRLPLGWRAAGRLLDRRGGHPGRVGAPEPCWPQGVRPAGGCAPRNRSSCRPTCPLVGPPGVAGHG